MSSSVIHRARVVRISDSFLTIALLQDNPSCGGCRLSSVCGKRDATEFDIALPQGYKTTEGDEIMVCASKDSSRRASVWLLATPLAALLAGIFIAQWTGMDEAMTAIAGLLTMTLCFFLLFYFRKRLDSSHTVWQVADAHCQ